MEIKGGVVSFLSLLVGVGGCVCTEPEPENVPQLLVTESGQRISSVSDWERLRAPEIRDFYTKEVYGKRPVERPPHLVFSVAEPDRVMMDGAAVRKRIRVEYGGAYGTNAFVFTAFIPTAARRPAPSLVLICNRDPKENIDPERVNRTEFWPAEEIVRRGFAAITFFNGDITPDCEHGRTQGIYPCFERDVFRKYRPHDGWGVLSAWAWGASRVMDWIEGEPSLDASHVAVIGHSRGGKTALVAAAYDSRFAMACSNDSGCGGAKLHHINLPDSEHIAMSNRSRRFWYCNQYAMWANRDREMPYDQHEFVALMAGGCACSEAWFHGARKQHLPYVRLQETCVTTTWMRFCEKLLETTGDPKWADQIERTFYNAYLGAMKADGSEFAGYTPLMGNRYHGQHHCFMHTDCCTANGPRGFLCFLKGFCRRSDKTATFNFYGSALVPGFDMYSLYPRQNWARIVSHTTGPLNVRLRIPAWSAKTVVKLNGRELPDVRPGSYFPIDRTWALGDIVEVSFDMPVIAHVLEHHVAFTRGPVLLARDSRFNDGDLTEPFRRGVKDGDVMATFAAVRAPSDDFWMAFSATLSLGSHHENPEGKNPETVFFCDYASAGNTWHRDNFYRTWFPIELGPLE